MAADPGISGETLRAWVRKDNTSSADAPARGGDNMETVPEGLAWLRAVSTRLCGSEKGWQLEREMLRRAAACFAQEMK